MSNKNRTITDVDNDLAALDEQDELQNQRRSKLLEERTAISNGEINPNLFNKIADKCNQRRNRRTVGGFNR